MKKLLITLALVLGFATAQGQNNEIPTFCPDKEEIEIAFFADIHVNLGNAMEREMRKAVEEVNSLPYDFVVIAGDLCNMGSDAELELVHEIVSKFNKPLMVTAGNHETT
ncbi:MAG: metallophosphoesterase, partial [Rikenellaceae bacterium]|nr:metallophosphoesterase [Rikenellaceae bacterium]